MTAADVGRALLALLIAMSIACCGNERDAAIESLQQDVKAILNDNPDLSDKDALIKARVKGRNGWTDVAAAARLFEEAKDASRDDENPQTDWSFLYDEWFDSWLKEHPERVDLLPVILDKTQPAIERLRQALKADCLVCPGESNDFSTINETGFMFGVRRVILMKLKRTDTAREEAGMFRSLMWRLDARPAHVAARVGQLRSLASHRIVLLAMEDKRFREPIDAALATKPVSPPGFREAWQYSAAEGLENALRLHEHTEDEWEQTSIWTDMSATEYVGAFGKVLNGKVLIHKETKEKALDLRSVADAKTVSALIEKTFKELPADELLYSREMIRRSTWYGLAAQWGTDAAWIVLEFARLAGPDWSLDAKWEEAKAIVARYPGLELVKRDGVAAVRAVRDHPFTADNPDTIWVEFPPSKD